MAEIIRLVPATKGGASQVESIGLQAPPPLALYVHLPWCLQKCPYCDFNSHQQPADGIAQAAYVDALIADLEQSLPLVWGRSVQTIFFGGGTPSLFEPAAIEQLLQAFRARLRINADAEITMEANPGTFEKDRFAGFAQAGVNRLSLGVQSFDDRQLARLGRVHDADAAHQAADSAVAIFDSVNIDLMFGLPNQSMAELEQDLRAAHAHGSAHLSCYQLTLETGTAFAVNPPEGLPDPDLSADMTDLVVQINEAAGLTRYEVSAYARAGMRCRHNLNYWAFGDYLGIGAGAHGKLSFHDRIVRQTRVRHPAQYLKAVAAGQAMHQERVLSPAELPFEFMLNALRLLDGVPVSVFAERTGLDPAVLAPALKTAHQAGLIGDDPGLLQASPKGMAFLNDLQMLFLED